MAARKRRNLNLILAPWIFTIAFFVIWEVSVNAFNISRFVLPAPTRIAETLWQFQGPLLYHSFHTAWMTLAGFMLAVVTGLVLGILLGASRFVNAGAYPLLVGFNAIPKVAVVPILAIWFGVGWQAPVLTAFLISFFPIVVNVATGISTVEPETEDVLRALGASKTDIVVKVGIPRAMPYFFGSLKVAITLAYVGSVIAEYNASNVGVGNLMARASADFNVSLLWASLVALAVLGVIMYALTAIVEERMTGWARRSQMAG